MFDHFTNKLLSWNDLFWYTARTEILIQVKRTRHNHINLHKHKQTFTDTDTPRHIQIHTYIEFDIHTNGHRHTVTPRHTDTHRPDRPAQLIIRGGVINNYSWERSVIHFSIKIYFSKISSAQSTSEHSYWARVLGRGRGRDRGRGRGRGGDRGGVVVFMLILLPSNSFFDKNLLFKNIFRTQHIRKSSPFLLGGT